MLYCYFICSNKVCCLLATALTHTCKKCFKLLWQKTVFVNFCLSGKSIGANYIIVFLQQEDNLMCHIFWLCLWCCLSVFAWPWKPWEGQNALVDYKSQQQNKFMPNICCNTLDMLYSWCKLTIYEQYIYVVYIYIYIYHLLQWEIIASYY